MKTDTRLIITHGTSDLQILLCDDKGRRWRAMPDKNIVRRFHEWLLEHTTDVEVIDVPPELLDRKAEALFTDWKGDTYALWLRDESPDAHPEHSPQGRLQLMLPKIEPALNQWLAEQTQTAKPTAHVPALAQALQQAMQDAGVLFSPLSAVLVLSTDRSLDEQEPVATFTFLKRWLINKGVPESAVSEFVFLHPGEKLESDYSPIAPAIAQRIEQAVRNVYDFSTNPTLLVANIGGLPQIKPLLSEMAVLFADNNAESLLKTERGTIGMLHQTPIDELHIRRQCLKQVQRGALLDAWALASPFHDDPDARTWVYPLEQAARLLNGNPVGTHITLPALKLIISHAKKAACLLVAIRIETALQNQRWLEAINGSLTFLEAAFHDTIKQWQIDALEEYRPNIRYMRFRADPPDILIKNEALVEWVGEKAGPFTYQTNMVGEKAQNAWDTVLKSKPLSELRIAIHKPVKLANDKRFRLADYRNLNTHGVMTQNEIDEAIKRFIGADLWAQGIDNPASRPKPGKCFLGRSLVDNVINTLIDPNQSALKLYQELLQQLEQRLIDPNSGTL